MRHLQSYSSLPANPKESGLSPLAKKLRLKPEHILAIVNAPPAYMETLEPGPATIVTELKPGHTYDAVQLFVNSVDEMRAMAAEAARAVNPDGLLWVTYRKGAFKNDVVGQVFGETGLKPVTLVKIDEVWTAVRLKSG